MTIGYLKRYFENTENPKFFLTDVFSWRGVYKEVAFTPSKVGSKEESLKIIERALTEFFVGYKGGDFSYDIHTEAHFENEESSWGDMALYKLLLND